MILNISKYLILPFFICCTTVLLAQTNIVELEQALDRAQDDKNYEKEAAVYIQIGDYYVNSGDINKGQRHYNRSIRTNKDNQFSELATRVHRQYARSYILEKKYDKAIESYEEALKIAQKNNHSEIIRDLKQEITAFQKELQQIKNAQNEYEQLKSMKKDDAIALIEQQNENESQETDAFLEEINHLSKENQLKELKLRFKENELDKKELKIQLLDQHNELKNAELDKKQAELAQKDAELAQKEAETRQQRTIIIFSTGALLLLSALFFVIIWTNKRQKKLNKLLTDKNQIIYLKNKETTDSIKYAKKIQEALLLSSKKQKQFLPESFIFYAPKDIVSGDFYWIHKTHDNKIIWTTVDCTGHGVPGAFMSMIGTRLLNEIVIEKQITEAGKILDEMKAGIIQSLNQEGKQGEAKDGMDMGLCVWDSTMNILEYAGANNSIYIVSDNVEERAEQMPEGKYKVFQSNLMEVKSNRIPIGYNPYINTPFDTVKIHLSKGDIIYNLSDGFQDQFGGERFKKYTTKRLKKLMISLQDTSMEKQKSIFTSELEQWKGNHEQIDDICIIGVRV